MKKRRATTIILACLSLLLIVPGQALALFCTDNMLWQGAVSTRPPNAVVSYEYWNLARDCQIKGYKITDSSHESHYFEVTIQGPDGDTCTLRKYRRAPVSATSWRITGTRIWGGSGHELRVTIGRPMPPGLLPGPKPGPLPLK